eukprot:10074656-Alexandrium_andersonii.AAC.1
MANHTRSTCGNATAHDSLSQADLAGSQESAPDWTPPAPEPSPTAAPAAAAPAPETTGGQDLHRPAAEAAGVPPSTVAPA